MNAAKFNPKSEEARAAAPRFSSFASSLSFLRLGRQARLNASVVSSVVSNVVVSVVVL